MVAAERSRPWRGAISDRTNPGIKLARRAWDCNEIGDIYLKVQYKDNKLEKLCTDEREMQKKRPDLKKKLRLRIKALENSDTFGDLPEDDPGGAWHDLKGKRAGTWAGELSGNWRLLVEPTPNSLSAVDAIVVDIEDYH